MMICMRKLKQLDSGLPINIRFLQTCYFSYSALLMVNIFWLNASKPIVINQYVFCQPIGGDLYYRRVFFVKVIAFNHEFLQKNKWKVI